MSSELLPSPHSPLGAKQRCSTSASALVLSPVSFVLLLFIEWENRKQQKLFPCSRGWLLNFFFSVITKNALCFASAFQALCCLSKHKFTSVRGT